MSPCLFNLHAEYILQNAELDESQAGIKTAWRSSRTLIYPDDTTPVIESEEELKSILMKVKEKSAKAGLKFNIQKTKIRASGPITSWQMMGKRRKQWQISFSWAPKSLRTVTAAMQLRDGCSSEEKLQQPNSVQFSRSVMSDSLQPRGLQHTRLPCPSPTPGACSNSGA